MYRTESSSAIDELLGQHNPYTQLNDTNNMQLLTRRIVLNLTKNVLQTNAKFTLPAASKIKLIAKDVPHQNYCSKNEKQKLLRFPAFPLDETLTKFLKTTEPLLDENEFEETCKAVEKFRAEDGPKLQKLLEKVAQDEENWLALRWLRVAYLQYRDPVTVYSSPGMTFPLQKPFKNDDDYLIYASKVVYSLVKYKQMIDKGEIPVVKMGKLELDNSQFERVFGTCRIPRAREDLVEYNPKSKHVVVIYKNHFYKLPVYNRLNISIHPEMLVQELQKIVDSEKSMGVPYGILSTDHRDNWAASYEELTKSIENQQNVNIIQKSLFTLSLDEYASFEEGKELSALALQLIHGGGADCNSGNRWMDKTIQVVVNRNGMSGFTYEHSPAEGQPIALMTDYVVDNLKKAEHYEGAACDNYEGAKKLTLKSTVCIDDHITKAKRNIDKLVADLTSNVVHFKNYGKGFLKKQKLSPDSYIQIGLQYAFYKLHKEPAAQYESAHLRIYYGGRTETIRSCSNESIAFARAMTEGNCSNEERVELLRKAVNGHREYTNNALQGRGVDRHLLGLKLMALENKLPVPEFYKCPGFVKSARFRVSTSQVASMYESFMSYGPSQPDGYAACYNPRENDIIVALTAWRSNDVTDVDHFAVAVCESFNSMHELLSSAGEKPKSKL